MARDGREVPIDYSAATIQDENQHPKGAVLVLRDITERRRVEKDLERRALYDALTDLGNRTLLRAAAAGDSGGAPPELLGRPSAHGPRSLQRRQ